MRIDSRESRWESLVPLSILEILQNAKIVENKGESDRFVETPLKTVTSLNKEVRLFFLGDNSIWSFSSGSSLSVYSIWRSCRQF